MINANFAIFYLVQCTKIPICIYVIFTNNYLLVDFSKYANLAAYGMDSTFII